MPFFFFHLGFLFEDTHIYTHIYLSIICPSLQTLSNCLHFLTLGILAQYSQNPQRMAYCIPQIFSMHEKNQIFLKSNQFEDSLYRMLAHCYWEQKRQPSLKSDKYYIQQLLSGVLPVLHTGTVSARVSQLIPRNLQSTVSLELRIVDIWDSRLKTNKQTKALKFTRQTGNILRVRLISYLVLLFFQKFSAITTFNAKTQQ